MSRAALLVPTNWMMSALFAAQAVGELLGEVDDLLAFGIVVGRDVDAGVEVVVVVDAVDRRLGQARATRVEPDDVEARRAPRH